MYLLNHKYNNVQQQEQQSNNIGLNSDHELQPEQHQQQPQWPISDTVEQQQEHQRKQQSNNIELNSDHELQPEQHQQQPHCPISDAVKQQSG